MKKLISLLLVPIPCILMVSCVNTHQAAYNKIGEKQTLLENNQENNISNHNSAKDMPFDLFKHYTSSSVKYYNYRKYDDQGRVIPEELSGAAGRFVWENNCLVFISAYGGYRATPILPYGITKWDYDSKTLLIKDVFIKMNDLIETGGVFYDTPPDKEGVCWNYPYVVSIGTMGKIRVLKSEKHLSIQP